MKMRKPRSSPERGSTARRGWGRLEGGEADVAEPFAKVLQALFQLLGFLAEPIIVIKEVSCCVNQNQDIGYAESSVQEIVDLEVKDGQDGIAQHKGRHKDEGRGFREPADRRSTDRENMNKADGKPCVQHDALSASEVRDDGFDSHGVSLSCEGTCCRFFYYKILFVYMQPHG